jgi:hypothetical protein
MPKRKGTALMMVWADVPAELEDDFNKWYVEEHISERMACPGFLNAARYEVVTTGPKHLAMYELESLAALETPEYQKVRANPSDWTKRVSPDVIGTTFIRNTYEMFLPDKLSDEMAERGMAPALQIGRINIKPEDEDGWNDWYNNVYIPNYEKVPGVISGRRFLAVEGEPKYLTVYDFENEKVSSTPEWDYQRTLNPANDHWQKTMLHLPDSPGIWRKTFEL